MRTDIRDHQWLVGGVASCGSDLAARSGRRLLARVDAHRRLRGPYTATGSLLRHLMRGMLRTRPELVQAHQAELRAVLPERNTPAATIDPDAVADGLTKLLQEYLAGTGGWLLTIDHADEADPTDSAFLAALLRGSDADRLAVAVRTSGLPLPKPLARALSDYAVRRPERPPRDLPVCLPDSQTEVIRLAVDFVATECLSPEPLVRAAYASLPSGLRTGLHDMRATELTGRGDLGPLLGAVCFHAERGSAPASAGVAALTVALDHCLRLGYTDAARDLWARRNALSAVDRRVSTMDRGGSAVGRSAGYVCASSATATTSAGRLPLTSGRGLSVR
jgi:hypothetical protein